MRSPTNFRLIGLAPLLLACLANTCSAAITYQFPPQDALDDGWAFDGGVVTTDGTLGEIGVNNFIDWSIGFRSPAGQYVIESENGSMEFFDAWIPIFNGDPVDFIGQLPFPDPLALVATAQHLMVPPVAPSDWGISTLSLIFSRNDENSSSLWPGLAVHIDHVTDSEIWDSETTGRMFDPAIEGPGFGRAGSSSFNVSTTDYVIASAASVPEPSSSVLFFFAFAGSAAFHSRTRSSHPNGCEP